MWEVWDEETVAQFVQWMYTGDYEWRSSVDTNKEGREATSPQDPEEVNQELTSNEKSTHEEANAAQEVELELEEQRRRRAEFDPPLRLLTPLGQYDPRITQTQLPPEREDKPAHFSFLTHAKIAVLAEYTDVQELKMMAVGRLLDGLLSTKSLENNKTAVESLVELIRYVYANTEDRISAPDPLRKMVSTFAAQNILEFRGTEVRKLLEDGGDFAVDVMSNVMRRMGDLHEQCKDYMNALERVDELNTELQVERSSSSAQLDNLRGTIASSRTRISVHELTIATHEMRIRSLESDLTGRNERIKNLEKETSILIKELETKQSRRLY